jgi:hypothetical protein
MRTLSLNTHFMYTMYMYIITAHQVSNENITGANFSSGISMIFSRLAAITALRT